MNKPYIICHMMMSIDGRIDCGMTGQLPGNDKYYASLRSLNASTRISGRVTAATELTSGQTFKSDKDEPIGKTAFAKNRNTASYNIVVDTKGSLLWPDDKDTKQSRLIITSEQATQNYLDYLTARGISWISAGKEKVDLKKAMEILADEFGVKRLAIVGGGKINAGFLEAGLIDEISIVIGAGVDGRSEQPSLFDGRPATSHPVQLQLKDVKNYSDDGTIWLRYLVK